MPLISGRLTGEEAMIKEGQGLPAEVGQGRETEAGQGHLSLEGGQGHLIRGEGRECQTETQDEDPGSVER